MDVFMLHGLAHVLTEEARAEASPVDRWTVEERGPALALRWLMDWIGSLSRKAMGYYGVEPARPAPERAA